MVVDLAFHDLPQDQGLRGAAEGRGSEETDPGAYSGWGRLLRA